MDVEKLVGILVGGIGFLLAYHYYIKSTHSTKAGPRPSVWKFRAFLLVLSIASWYAIVVPSKPQKFISINDIKIIIKNPMETTNVLPESPWNEHGYVDTGFGKTHYYLIGNPSDPKLVFIHGLTTPPALQEIFLNKLASSGFRILAYDLYGRAYSDTPDEKYSNGFYISQLATLLYKLDWPKSHFVGYSLGGAILAGFASRYPDKVEKMTLIAPAGIMEKDLALLPIVKTPILGEIFLYTFGRKVLLDFSTASHLKSEAESPDVAQFNTRQGFHLKHHPGILEAIRSTVFYFDFKNQAPAFRALEKTHAGKVLCIWGEKDKVVPTDLHLALQELIPSVKMQLRRNFSHSIVLEDSSMVVDLVSTFFFQ